MLYVRLAWRNIWRHRRRTLIIMLAMGLGLALMMLYDGLIDGFQQAIYGNAIKVLGGNVRIHAAGYKEKANTMPLLPLEDDAAVVRLAESLPEVAAATRRINTTGLASNREGAFAVNMVGIEPEREAPFSLIAQHITEGRYLTSEDGDLVLIGRGLANLMGVRVGERIVLVARSTHEQMRRRTMTVVGIYDLGLPSIEKRTLYISLSEAQNLFDLRRQSSTEVVLTLKKVGEEARVIAALAPALGHYEIQSWAESFPELQQAIGTKSGAMLVFSLILFLIAGIGILNLLLMAVYERRREIGLLAALGLPPRQIMLLFILEGALLGVVGSLAGAVLGVTLNGILGVVGIDYSQYANITEYMALISGRVYPTLALNTLLKRALPLILIATLAALYPAREAAQHEPAQALHYV